MLRTKNPSPPDGGWKNILMIVGPIIFSFLAGLLAPAVATLLRSARKEGERRAKETADDTDDVFWRVVGPSFDRVADALDKNDIERARTEFDRLKVQAERESKNGKEHQR